MDKKEKIGIFDSGIGGVAVLKEILKILPNEDYIYYSDSVNNPYGDKTRKQIISFCEDIVGFLIKENCKIIVIACNTATAEAAKYLRNKYKDIIFIGIEPAYKMVYDYSYDKPTLIMATKKTIISEKFNLLFSKYNNKKTEIFSCEGLADIIEKNEKEKIGEYIEKNLTKYKGNIENVVLGCTHYPLIKEEIEKVIGKVNFFDGAYKLAIHLKEVLEEKDMLNNEGGKIKFIDSEKSEEKEKRFFEILKNK